ncbi:MAG: hypothetical protein IPM46_10725 [Flavobacteriales bacterium]|nr:hypothetical protein [Flavobacteriales bacterium]
MEWAQFWKAAGISVLLGQVALFGISGLSLLSIPRPPTAMGDGLAVEVEVMVPLARITPRSREAGQIRMSLYAGDKDNHSLEIDTARFREEDGKLIVPALAPLHSRSSVRILSFHIEEHTWLAFDLPLPPSPAVSHGWSGSEPLRDARTAGSNAQLTDVLLRYRVVVRGGSAEPE